MGTIPVFDKYFIKEWWDHHWIEPEEPRKAQGAEFYGKSLFEKEVVKALDKSYVD